jgi:CheY-like chemotaxis protein
LPEVVRADEKRLRQILINVLGNAVKFTQTGRVEFRVSHQREMAVFEIEDTGPGIAADDIEQMFEPFARGSEASGGTGLGLTISKMLTGLMGGEMTVRSTPAAALHDGSPAVRSGTVFRIRLFLPEVHGARLPPELPQRLRTGYSGPRRRLLVVDNEEVERDLLVSVLQPLGFEIATVSSGHACLAWLTEQSTDAILMDLAMPGIDGWATVRAIRDQGLSTAPIAIVSGNAFDKGLENDVGIGIEDFILKPVRVGELLDWLVDRLQLDWIAAPPAVVAAPVPAPLQVPTINALPSAAQLQALDELVSLGYFRGIVRKLDEIEAGDASLAGFVTPLRALASQFQLDAMTRVIRQALIEREPAP